MSNLVRKNSIKPLIQAENEIVYNCNHNPFNCIFLYK